MQHQHKRVSAGKSYPGSTPTPRGKETRLKPGKRALWVAEHKLRLPAELSLNSETDARPEYHLGGTEKLNPRRSFFSEVGRT